MKKPELLAPAGTFERAKIAYLYGADAVYAGTADLSLRTRVNINNDEFVKIVGIYKDDATTINDILQTFHSQANQLEIVVDKLANGINIISNSISNSTEGVNNVTSNLGEVVLEMNTITTVCFSIPARSVMLSNQAF